MTQFQFHIEYRTPNSQALTTTHDLAQLIVVVDGEGMHRTAYGDHLLRAGNLFVVSGKQNHTLDDQNGLYYYNVMYDPAQFLKPTTDTTRLPGYHALFQIEPLYRLTEDLDYYLHLDVETLGHVTGLITEIYDEYLRQAAGFQTIIMAYFMQLVVYLSRQYNAENAPDTLWRLARVLAHVEVSYAGSITLEDLAEIADMSINHFLRTFKRMFGVSPIDYVIRQRLLKACQLMQQTDAPINQIAAQVGFADSNYFSRQFRKVMGKSPRDLRKELQAVALI